MKKEQNLQTAETQALNIPVVSTSIPLFQYNAVIESQRQMMEHIEFLNRENENLRTQNKKLKFMVENGLGEDDMKNDITYPHEL